MTLTIQQIQRSAWARRFKMACPGQYEEALALAQNVGSVSIEQRDDHGAKGDFTWAITPEANTEFWLDGLVTAEFHQLDQPISFNLNAQLQRT